MNDPKMSGDELIAAERERQVLVHDRPIVWDLRHNTGGQLLQMAVHLIEPERFPAPPGWDAEQVAHMDAKPQVERCIYAGAFIAAHIDMVNLMNTIETKLADESNNQVSNLILPPDAPAW